MIRLSERDGFRNLRFKERLKIKGGIIMKKAEKQEYVREVVAVGVFVVALCAVCAFMNGTGYVPFSVVC